MTAFWIPAKPLHLRGMLSKSKRCTENCNPYRRYWSTKWAQFFSMTMPNHTSHNQCFSSWTYWDMKSYLISHNNLTSHKPPTTTPSISMTFCREHASTTSRNQKMFSTSSLNPTAWICMLQEYTNLFLVGKNVLITMVLILVNKNVFEYS